MLTMLSALGFNITTLLITVVTAILGGLVAWVRKRGPKWRAFWSGVYDGLSALPGLQQDVAKIGYYVAPNGGGSLSDAITKNAGILTELSGKVDLISQTISAQNDADEYIARFQCAASGENIYVNQLYARWMGVGKSELLGWKFLNFIHPDDVERVRQHWEECRRQNRQCKLSTTLVAASGEEMRVEVCASPVPENPPTKWWIGTIRKLDHDRRKADR